MAFTKEELKLLKILVDAELKHHMKDESMLHADTIIPDMEFLVDAKEYEKFLKKLQKKFK